MRKILSVAVLACLALGAAAPRAAYADDDNSMQVGKDTFVNVGTKLWLNTWQTNLTGSGRNWNQITEGPVVGVIPNLAVRHKNLFVSGSFMVTPDYSFPLQTNYIGSGGVLDKATIKGSRQEIDMNVGYYIIPQVALTIGYKGVTEKFKVSSSVSGYSENSVYLNGMTFGITGSAPIGNGWSVYGSGAGGFMSVTYLPSSNYTDGAGYEASELGFAWHPHNSSFSTTLGYKFQLIQTKISSLNSTAYASLPRNEVTRGFMLGANYTF
ncbi:MAG: hypothetical protein KGJ84_00690 [Elusimicrobia bacterium]|nr:hypothetical protein [Elusimicrobiota bacterium]